MSTKTTFKRIALVAVVALGIGGLSTVSAFAVGDDKATPTVGLVKGSASTSATITGVVGGQVAFTVSPSTTSTRYITSDAGGTIVSVTATGSTSVTATNGLTVAGGATWAGTTSNPLDGETATVTATSATAGTQVIKVTTIDSTTGVSSTKTTVTITWAAAATASTVSTAFITTGATAASANTTSPYATKAAAGIVANIAVSLKDASANALVGQKLTVTVAGPGTICAVPGAFTAGTTALTLNGTCTNTGIRAYSDTTANTTSQWLLGLFSDGTSGTTTITVSVGTTVIGTKTFYFTDSVSKIEATQVYSIARAGSAGYKLGDARVNSIAAEGYVAAAYVLVTDKNGNPITGLTDLSCKSGDVTVISSCTIIEDNNATYGNGAGYYNVEVNSAPGGASGASTTIYVRKLNSDGTTYTESAKLTYTLGGSIATTQVSLDAASYAPGAPVVMTVTAKDSSGNLTYDGQAIAYAISASMPAGGALPSAAKLFAKGKYATSSANPTLFAPATVGSWKINVTGNDVANTVATASANVVNASADAATDAANEATDAANAATDAALAAADAADAATAAAQDASDAVAALSATVATLVAGLKAQITSLTNLVIKIQKKVKA
jgi:trimeric autotransporter adhesin